MTDTAQTGWRAAKALVPELLHRAADIVGDVANRGNVGPHHLISEMAACLEALASAPPPPAVNATAGKIVTTLGLLASTIKASGVWKHEAELQEALEAVRLLAASPAVMSGRTDLVRAMCKTRAFDACACADNNQTADYTICEIIARHADAIRALSPVPVNEAVDQRQERKD